MSSFLTSQLNVELVYTILTGIVNFTENPDLQVDTSNTEPVASMTLNSIKIKDFKFWENTKNEGFVVHDVNSVHDSAFDIKLRQSV